MDEESVKTFLNKHFVEIADVVSDRSHSLAAQLEKERDSLSEVILQYYLLHVYCNAIA